MTTHPRKSRLALPVIAAAQLLIVMDGTIVTVGLPDIGAGLRIGRPTSTGSSPPTRWRSAACS